MIKGLMMIKRLLSVLVAVAVACTGLGCNRKPDPRSQPGFQDTSDPSTITREPPDPTKTGNQAGVGTPSSK